MSFVRALQVLVPIFSAVCWLLLFCLFGNYVTTRFEDESNAVYQLDWYLMPLDMQKNLPMFITSAQKSVYLRGFAGAQCTREVFKQVLIN